MTNLNHKTFRLLMCMLVFCLLTISPIWGDALSRYSKNDPRIKEMIEGVSDKPGDYSLRVAENLIGTWKAQPMMSKSLSENTNVTWQSIRFQTNGIVEISYKLSSEDKTRQFVGSYEIIHKAREGRGNPPNIMIRSRDTHNENFSVLVHVRIGEFNFFPPDLPVLWFQDPDGYNYSFEPVGASAEHRLKLLGRGSVKEQEVIRRQMENHRRGKVRIADSNLTQQISANLKEGKLTEPERNKEILRLMNEGDVTCVPVLLEHLQADHSLVVRQNAIRALGKIGDKQAVTPLLNILRKPIQGKTEDEAEDDAILRRNAVVALGDIGDLTALPVLKTVAESAREYQSVRDLARITARKMEESKGTGQNEGVVIRDVLHQTTNQTAAGIQQIPGSGKTNDIETSGNTGKP